MYTMMMLLLQKKYIFKIDPVSDIHVFEKPNNWILYMLTIFINKIEVAETITITLSRRYRVMLRNFVSHPLFFFFVSSPYSDGLPSGVDHGSCNILNFV